MPKLAGHRASEVFGARLKAARTQRQLTQQQLSGLMTDVGIPMSKTSLVRIEKGVGERGLALDEALAFAAVLGASPSHLLTPEADVQIALTNQHRTNASRIRDWLRTGTITRPFTRVVPPEGAPFVVPGEGFDMGRPNTHLREGFEREMALLAETLLDAYRGGDKEGTRDAVTAIFAAVDSHRAAREEG